MSAKDDVAVHLRILSLHQALKTIQNYGKGVATRGGRM